jgi:hypothetical protein
MSKKINLVYEWIGPKGPVTNNRVPTLIDIATAATGESFQDCGYKNDLHQSPHFYLRFSGLVNYVPAFNVETSTFLYELNFHNYHYRDIFKAFTHNDGLLENASPSENIATLIKDKKGYLLITLLYEGFLDDLFLKGLTEYFSRKHIPLTQIVYVSNCYNGQSVYESFCRRNNILPEMKMEYLPVFRIDKTDLELILETDISYSTAPKKKLFLCFNRRHTEHRVLFYIVMSKLELIDRCFYSMSKEHPGSSQTFFENAKNLSSKYKELYILDNDIAVADARLPLVLDTDDFSNYPMEIGIDDVKPFYDNSYINIVMETYFFNNIIHITEKTYKPIAFMQPFILFAAPYGLQHIKDMGFKTFDAFWDESYDTETDHTIRFLKIAQEIKKISNWSQEMLDQFANDVRPILEFNRQHFKTMKNIEVDQFVEKYGVEG